MVRQHTGIYSGDGRDKISTKWHCTTPSFSDGERFKVDLDSKYDIDFTGKNKIVSFKLKNLLMNNKL